MTYRLPRIIAIIGGIAFAVPGVWPMIDPRSFFDSLATFEPYNKHFIQDIVPSRSASERCSFSRVCSPVPVG